jgi:hypothetical protein
VQLDHLFVRAALIRMHDASHLKKPFPYFLFGRIPRYPEEVEGVGKLLFGGSQPFFYGIHYSACLRPVLGKYRSFLMK